MTRKGLIIRWLLAAAAIAAIVLYLLFDPSESSLAPKCMLHVVTGFECPGCGSQRMLHALLNGNFREAWHYNAFVMCLIPVLALMGAASLMRTRTPRLYNALNSVPVIVILSASVVIWTLYRNLA